MYPVSRCVTKIYTRVETIYNLKRVKYFVMLFLHFSTLLKENEGLAWFHGQTQILGWLWYRKRSVLYGRKIPLL